MTNNIHISLTQESNVELQSNNTWPCLLGYETTQRPVSCHLFTLKSVMRFRVRLDGERYYRFFDIYFHFDSFVMVNWLLRHIMPNQMTKYTVLISNFTQTKSSVNGKYPRHFLFDFYVQKKPNGQITHSNRGALFTASPKIFLCPIKISNAYPNE